MCHLRLFVACLALLSGCAYPHHRDLAAAPPRVGVWGHDTVVRDDFLNIREARIFYDIQEAATASEALETAAAAAARVGSRRRSAWFFSALLGGIAAAAVYQSTLGYAPSDGSAGVFAMAGALGGSLLSIPIGIWVSKSPRREAHEAVRNAADIYNAGLQAAKAGSGTAGPADPKTDLSISSEDVEVVGLVTHLGEHRNPVSLRDLEFYYREQGLPVAAGLAAQAVVAAAEESRSRRIGMALGFLVGVVGGYFVGSSQTGPDAGKANDLIRNSMLVGGLGGGWAGHALARPSGPGDRVRAAAYVEQAAGIYRHFLKTGETIETPGKDPFRTE